MMHRFQHKNIIIDAITIGGIETCYYLPQHNIAFDVGKCPENILQANHIFLTHGHLDHAAGLPYLLSQRSLRHMAVPRIFVPPQIADDLNTIVKIWQKIEGFDFHMEFTPFPAGERFYLRPDLYVEALPSFHRIPCNGYALIQNIKKLKPEFVQLPGPEIKRRKDLGEELFDARDVPLFAFSGDSLIEFVKENEKARHAKVLFLECTYIEESRPITRARQWGHIHLDEIIENKDLFANEKLVLVHFSKRYTVRKIKEILKAKIPPEMQSQVTFIANNYPHEIAEANSYLEGKQKKMAEDPA